METAMRNVSINDRTTPTMSPLMKSVSTTQQEQPLDFSTKVRQHTNSEEEDAQRKISADSAIDCSNDNSRPNSPTNIPHQPSSSSQLPLKQSTDHRVPPLIGQPPVSMQMPNINSFLPQNNMAAAASAGMGMFYPGSPMFPNLLPPGFSGPMWPNPMAAMIQQQQEAARKLMSHTAAAAAVSKQSPVGVEHLNKLMMAKAGIPQHPRGFPHLPGMPGFPTPPLGANNLPNIPDPNILAEALKSHEEMFNAYKQQVLSQKATDEAKRGPRRHPPAATVTNGHSQNGSHAEVPHMLSQISEDQSDTHSNQDEAEMGETRANSDNSSEIDVKETSSSSSEDGKTAGACSSQERSHGMPAFPMRQMIPVESGVVPGLPAPAGVHMPPGVSSQVLQGSTGTSLHSSDESLQTHHTDSSGRRSCTPAHSSTSELNDINDMRPRSMTLPTQSDNRGLSYSPSPSVLSTGHSGSGSGTPDSKQSSSGSFRKRARTLPEDLKVGGHSHKSRKDEAYWERRRKNNEAAKRSRDSRRAKEDEIAIRAAFLEQENIRLRIELASLKTQTAKLRSELIIFQSPEDHHRARGRADGS